MKHNNRMSKLLSIFAVLTMVMVALAVPMSSSDDSEAASSTWTYKISITGNTSTVSISGVTDGNGNATTNLTSSSVGSWGWDNNSEYGPFGSYYAAFNSSGKIMYHVRADDLNSKVGSVKGANDVDKAYNIMWVLPTVYWSVDSNGNLILSNDSSKGTAYAHTIDGNIYPYLAIGVYETQVKDGKAMSLSGVSPTASTTRPQFRTASEYTIDTDGDNAANGYSMQWNYYQWSLYKYCTFATLGTFNSQSFAGGPVSSSIQTTGIANASESGMPSGYYTKGSSNTSASARLFLENAWGSTFEFVDNTYVNNGVWYVGQTHNASDNSTNKTNIGQMSTSNGYTKTINTSANNWGLPASVGASDKTGLCDYYYYGSGECSVRVGGSCSNGSSAGVSFVRATNSLSTSSSGVGSRLSFVFDADPASGYKVTFDANGGECDVTSVIVGKGKTLELPTPTRQFWVFQGWFNGNTLIGMGGKTITVTGDMNLLAHWTEQTVNLTFYYNLPEPTGGSNIYKVVAVKINTSPASLMPDNPTQYGLNFAGWYNETGCTTTFDPTVIMAADDQVYAKWTNTLKILSVPTIACITHNTYSMSVDLAEGQTAIWFDSADNQIGQGAKIDYTFKEGGVHNGYVKIYDSNGESYGDVEWSVDVDSNTNNGTSTISVIAVILIIAAIGYFALRRL